MAGLAFLAQLAIVAPAAAADFSVYRVKASLPIHVVVQGGAGDDAIVKTKLTEKHLLNLALGRPANAKVDRKTEILALATSFESPSASPLARLIVFDPSKDGLARVITTVARATLLDYEPATVKRGQQGQGTARAEIEETTLGDPTMHALHATSVLCTGAGKTIPDVPPGPDRKLDVKAAVAGRMSYTTTSKGQTTTLSGNIVNGKAQVSGKPIGFFSE